MPNPSLLTLITRFALGLCLWLLLHDAAAEDPLQLQGRWSKSAQGGVYETFTIHGTRDRNNPIRRKLKPFSGDHLFVQFRLTYTAASIDDPESGDGEFFVFWLDDHDGGDKATHTGRAPNVGLHVTDNQNRFMVRYDAGRQQFSSIQLEGDRTYRVAARLSKTDLGPERPFDRIDLWVDPAYYDEEQPDATARHSGAISTVEWIGFSTGRKTEATDLIHVSDVRLATSWREMLGLPPATPRPAAEPPAASAPTRLTATVDFRSDVLPILEAHCFECHRGSDPDSGVRLDVAEDFLNHVTPGQGSASPLIALVRSSDDRLRMPPPDEGRAPLDESQVDTLITWIDEGLDWDETRLPTPRPQTDHWAFQPIERPEVPSVENQDWVRTPVDAFIAQRHEQLALAASELAAPETLARRIALDLTGLPPDPGLVKTELTALAAGLPGNADHRTRPEASVSGSPRMTGDQGTHQMADTLVEQYLQSPHYGERYGRHWLDLARWGESNGHQHNRDRPHAWRYRDYVIQSFQHDKPFDHFIRQQIAGDEGDYTDENLIATGFLAAARYSGNELDHEIQRNDILVDVVNTTADVFLGVTMSCVQCHSHKFDPFSTVDYYRLQAFFGKGQPGNLVLQQQSESAERLIAARWEMFDDVHARLVAARRAKGAPEPVLVIPKTVFAAMKGSERELFRQIEDEISALPQTWGWNAPASTPAPLAVAPHEMRWPLPHDPERIDHWATYIRIRGDVKARGPEVQPGWPAVFGPTPSQLSKPRTALADWLASSRNPLTARVWVNRIWQWHFGRGLVDTSGDFGTQGAPPTHTELLDWLASELITHRWSTNHIHRLILRSNTYRQSAAFSQTGEGIDPENRYLWRWRPRRLEAESIRDCVLAVAGKIDTTPGGPSVGIDRAAASLRRSVYLQQKRNRMPEALSLFDAPEAIRSCSRRRVSTVALQPLYLLNSQFMNSMAGHLAERVRASQSTRSEQTETAIRLVLGRQPDEEELERGEEFLAANSLESFCLSLLNLNEFLYIN